jgi:hypothetical protein
MQLILTSQDMVTPSLRWFSFPMLTFIIYLRILPAEWIRHEKLDLAWLGTVVQSMAAYTISSQLSTNALDRELLCYKLYWWMSWAFCLCQSWFLGTDTQFCKHCLLACWVWWQVVFTGGPNQPGTTKPEEGARQPYSVLNCEATRESILPYVLFLQKIIRRRPFMIKTLENVMRRLLQSLVSVYPSKVPDGYS